MLYLPALKEKTAIDGAEPHDSVTRLEVTKPIALVVQINAQALEKLGRGRLYDGLAGGLLCLGRWRGRRGGRWKGGRC